MDKSAYLVESKINRLALLISQRKGPFIRHHLLDNDCFYSGDIEPVVEMLELYGISRADIETEFDKGV